MVEYTDEFNRYVKTIRDADTILIPKTLKRHLQQYAPISLLKEIDPDKDIAFEKCLIFVSNLSSTYFTDNKWKALYSAVLHDQLKIGGDNSFVYPQVIKVLKYSTPKHSPVIEVKKSIGGKETYEVGKSSKNYRLAERYLEAGLTTYTLKNDELVQRREDFIYQQYLKSIKNPIIENLIEVYPRVTLPSMRKINAEAKKLVQSGYTTNKGLRLTFLDGKDKSDFADADQLSFVEESISLFKALTKGGYMIPSEGGVESGYRVTDSFNLMPSWIRKLCLIDGNPIVENDFGALHPNLAVRYFSGEIEFEEMSHAKVAQHLGISRNEVKIQHLSFFNMRWDDMRKSKLFPYYQDKYPQLLEVLKKMKEEHGHKYTSRWLFTFEVWLMKAVIERLMEEGVFTLYVYDALYSQEQHAPRVREVMNEAAKKYLIEAKAF